MSDVCSSCATPLPADRAKCAKCGKVDLDRARAISRAGAEALRASGAARVAARVLLYGSLVASLLVVGIELLLPRATIWRAAMQHSLFALLIGAGLWTLGPGAFAASLGARVRASHFLPTIATGVVAGLVWWGWNRVQRRLFGHEAFGAPVPLDVGFWTSAFLVPSLLQELLCRGATWEALRRFQTPRVTNIVTAAQFAVTYGIVWRLHAMPGRFVVGLLLGRLRQRTGGLAPCIAAHLLAKGLALALPF